MVLAAIGRLYPEDKRTKALGIATAVGSGGQFVMVQVSNAIESSAGWRTSLVVLGLVAGAVLLLARPLRGTAADALAASNPTGSAGGESLRQVLDRASTNRSYLLLNAGFFVCGFHVTFIATHVITYFEDVGVSGAVAGLSWGLVGLFNVAGAYGAGVLGQRHRKTHLLSLIYAGRGLVMMMLVLMPSGTGSALVFGALMGLLWLATVPLTGGIVAQQFGTQHSGTLFGIVFLSHQIGAFVGVYGGGWIADTTGSYVAMWWIAIVLAAFATLVHLFIDEGPQPLEPVERATRRGVRLRPAAGLSVLLVVAALVLAPRGSSASTSSGDTSARYCVLHPTVVPDS